MKVAARVAAWLISLLAVFQAAGIACPPMSTGHLVSAEAGTAASMEFALAAVTGQRAMDSPPRPPGSTAVG